MSHANLTRHIANARDKITEAREREDANLSAWGTVDDVLIKQLEQALSIVTDALEEAIEPRPASTIEEFAIVGEVSGKHISVSRSDAENIAARGNLEVVTRAATEWKLFTPTDAGSET